MAKPIGAVKPGQMPKLDAAVEKAMAKAEADTEQTGNQPADVAPGMMRIHIVSPDHTDGKAKKTWLRDSVIEIDERTALVMVNVLKCAFPTDEPINEIFAAYKGK
jgi:hypothetical protein